MKKILHLITLFCLASAGLHAQVGIGTTTPNNSAVLDLTSANKGFLVPRMTTVQRTAISSPAKGLMVFDNDSSYFFYFDGSSWKGLKSATPISYSGGTGITITGGSISAQNNTAIWNASQIEGKNISNKAPTSNQVLKYNSVLNEWTAATDTGVYTSGNTSVTISGTTITANNTTATWNANQLEGKNVTNKVPTNNQVLKYNSGLNEWTPATDTGTTYTAGSGITITSGAISTTVPQNITGTNNTSFGTGAGVVLSTGHGNAFTGTNAGTLNNSGIANTFDGAFAGAANTSGSYNTAVGNSTLTSNTSGGNNTALGASSGQNNATGINNDFVGVDAGFLNTSGSYNNFLGINAGYLNTIGSFNTFIGNDAGYSNTTGGNNIALGNLAGYTNTTGYHNTLIGDSADVLYSNLSNATAIGFNARVAQSNSIVLGNGANVGIGTSSPVASAILQLNSTSQGFLLPSMTTALRTGITSPATGLQVYDNSLNE